MGTERTDPTAQGEAVLAITRSLPDRPADASVEDWFAVTQLLGREAQLLDERRYREWLELYTADATYWIPIKHDDPDPQRDVSIAYDDRSRLEERVSRLASGFMYAQDPPSRTCHLVGGVQVWRVAPGVLKVRSSLVVSEVRGRRRSLHSGAVVHELNTDEGSLRIAQKTVWLIESDLPLENLTFIL